MKYHILVDSFSCVVELMLSMYFFSSFGNIKTKNKITVLIISSLLVIYIFILFLFSSSIITFLFSVFITFILSLCYDFKLHNCIMLSIVISCISTIAEFTVALIISSTKNDISYANNNISSYIIGLLLSKFIAYIIITIIRKGKHNLLLNTKDNYFFAVLVLPVSSILVIISQYEYVIKEVSIKLRLLSTIALVLLITANVFIFYIIDKQFEIVLIKEKLKTSEHLLEIQKKYYDELFCSEQEIRKIRHDLNNIFIVLKANLDNNDIIKSKAIVETKLKELDKTTEYVNDSNSVIEAIVESKISIAKASNILVNKTIRFLTSSLVDELDIAVLTANILDNAIEASLKIKDKSKAYIDLTIIFDSNNIIVKCRNGCYSNIDINNLKTTKSDHENHGFGLSSVRTITSKYKGELAIDFKNNEFIIMIILPNNYE